MKTKYKLLLLAITVVGLGIILLITQNQGKTGVIVDTSPKEATITINGEKYSSGFISLSPGTYTLEVSHYAFKPQQRTVTVAQGKRETLTVFLNPNGESGSQWLKEHPEEVARREAVGSKVVDELAEQQSKELPIIDQLPLVDNFYRIDYGVSKKYPKDSTKTALYVRYYSQEGIVDANDWLLANGVDIQKEEIIYIDAVEEQE